MHMQDLHCDRASAMALSPPDLAELPCEMSDDLEPASVHIAPTTALHVAPSPSVLPLPAARAMPAPHFPFPLSPTSTASSGHEPAFPAVPSASATGTSPPPGELSAHVTIWNRRERRKIAGNAAPLRRNVARYLADHPDCEVYRGQDRKPGSKPKKSIKRRRPAPTPVIVYASEAAAAAHADGRAVYEVRNDAAALVSAAGFCYDYRRCRRNRCGIHADLDSSLRGTGSCPDRDAIADPDRYDSDFGALLRMAQHSADEPLFASPSSSLGALPTHLVMDKLPVLCSDFSDDDTISSIIA